jgi:excisionase family DNA binding protein
MSKSPDQFEDDRLLVTPEEAARRLSIGRTRIFALIAEGELVTVTIGRTRRVPVSSLRSFVDQLITNSNGECDDTGCRPASADTGQAYDDDGSARGLGSVQALNGHGRRPHRRPF